VPTVYARTLRRSAEIVGGEDVLANRLGVSRNQLAIWINDLVTPPSAIFIIAADIVGQYELDELRKLNGSNPNREPNKAT